MTATQIVSTIASAHQVGDRVRVQRKGVTYPGRISSIHHRDNGVEYVVRTDAAGEGMARSSTSGRPLGTPPASPPPRSAVRPR